jgi:hypothetical protein
VAIGVPSGFDLILVKKWGKAPIDRAGLRPALPLRRGIVA